MDNTIDGRVIYSLWDPSTIRGLSNKKHGVIRLSTSIPVRYDLMSQHGIIKCETLFIYPNVVCDFINCDRMKLIISNREDYLNEDIIILNDFTKELNVVILSDKKYNGRIYVKMQNLVKKDFEVSYL